MDAIIGIVQSIGAFLAGVVARVGLFLAVLAALAIPALVLLAAGRGAAALRRRALGVRDAAGVLFRPGLYYAAGHTWLRPQRERLRIGIDDLAQRLIPWAISIELPRPSARVREGEPVASISCGGKVVRIASPVEGAVVAVNAAVASDPSLVKRDNYGRGWLFEIAPADARYLALPTGDAALGWMRREASRLTRFFEDELGIATADGGEWVSPPPALLRDEQWKALTQAFLHVS